MSHKEEATGEASGIARWYIRPQNNWCLSPLCSHQVTLAPRSVPHTSACYCIAASLCSCARHESLAP
jgi:hypothetical protein